MSKSLTRQLLPLMALLVPAALLAQDELLDEAEVPIKYYTVELIVFTYAENVGTGTEVFPPDPIDVANDPINEVGVDERSRRHPDAVGLQAQLLQEDQFTMQDTMSRLKLLDAYDPILHVGWTQAGFPLQDTDPIELTRFGRPPDGLTGSFTLYLARFLHLVVDLEMDGPAATVPVQFDDQTAYSLEDIGPRQGPVHYRISEDRIVKNGEVRYFDHPKFGVVAKVTRVEAATDGSSSLLSRVVQ